MRTIESLHEFEKFARAKDSLGMAQMMVANKAVQLEKDTEVKIVDEKIADYSFEVRILSGKHSGELLFVRDFAIK